MIWVTVAIALFGLVLGPLFQAGTIGAVLTVSIGLALMGIFPFAGFWSKDEILAKLRDILVDLGVPASSISLEEGSENTIENIEFVRLLVGNEAVALVTSAYHMPRALRLARMHGLKAAAFPADWQLAWQQRPPWLSRAAGHGLASDRTGP